MGKLNGVPISKEIDFFYQINASYYSKFFALYRKHNRHGPKPRFYPVFKEACSQFSEDEPRKRKTRHSQNPPVEHHVGWIMGTKEQRPNDGSDVGSLGSRYNKDTI